MSGNQLFLDTNIVLYLLNGDETLADFLQEKQLYISIITEMELLGYSGITKKESTKIEEFIEQCVVLSINNRIKRQAISIRKTYKNKLPDAIIAATALYLNLPLITSDSDFSKIEELELIHYEN